ncbi:MAG: divalent-cation tolerance protein CutA [Bdellovibrionales bacterium]|nr:divalent-cation tolerance protein CutA [Bdellovibrionales bacterium]
MSVDALVLGYITCANSKEANYIAFKLVEKELIACANVIDSISSIYKWEGAIVEDKESLLLVKTKKANIDLVSTEVRKLHSYKTPCIVFYDSLVTEPNYLNWAHSTISKK